VKLNLKYIKALPQNPYLEKQLIGKSDGNREHWELKITDPSIAPGRKQTIYWQTREHGYETFSSFAMEGLISYLLSDEASQYRKRYIFVLHPMTNVDGVANGFEYRAGYDFPDPRGTATGRLIYETIDSTIGFHHVTGMWYFTLIQKTENQPHVPGFGLFSCSLQYALPVTDGMMRLHHSNITGKAGLSQRIMSISIR
jgi:hypothetical protein